MLEDKTTAQREQKLVTILVRYATLTLIPKVVPTCACRTVSMRLENAYNNPIQIADSQQYPNERFDNHINKTNKNTINRNT